MVWASDLLHGWNREQWERMGENWSSALIGFEGLNDFDDDV
jgi:hypothetical protein